MIRGFVGSPNKDGMTATIVREALLGAEEQGAEVDLVHLSDHRISEVPDCHVVHENGKDAGPDDDFDTVAALLDDADAVVIGSPVYWSTITTEVRALLSRKLRVEMGRGPTSGMRALAIVVAGGSGNGLTEAMKPMYLFFEKLRWRPLDCFPVTRFNWDRALVYAHEAGRDLAAVEDRRNPVIDGEYLRYYNDLKYRSYDRIDERRLLAELVIASLPETGKFAGVAGDLRDQYEMVRTMFLKHRKVEAIGAIDDLIERGTELWTVLHPSGRVLEEKGE
jgi:NAD(P)H-dependent FMN reductase